ncbi:MAG: glycerophosphodiester phosphodiesterase [Candidatus Latescibacteria bacterium]|nr:glycerophosphodiester phosphodiesterase [Candidatus Latescibacterota bacterium]
MRKLSKVLLGLVLLLVVVCVGLAILTGPMPDHPFIKRNGVEVIAHRGGWRLWPENTLYAFQHSVDMGVDILEMDIRSTKDGHLVVIHDEKVDRTTNGTGRVRDLTLAELKQLDAGYRWSPDKGETFPFRGQGIVIPTLIEVFEAFPQMRMSIEIKRGESDVVEVFGELIRQYGMQDQVLVPCSDSGTLKRFRKRFPEIATSPGLTEGLLFYVLSWLQLGAIYHPNVEVLQFPLKFRILDGTHPRIWAAARSHNIQVQVWTVDNEADMRMLVEREVDGIITRRPDRLLRILGRLSEEKE